MKDNIKCDLWLRIPIRCPLAIPFPFQIQSFVYLPLPLYPSVHYCPFVRLVVLISNSGTTIVCKRMRILSSEFRSTWTFTFFPEIFIWFPLFANKTDKISSLTSSGCRNGKFLTLFFRFHLMLNWRFIYCISISLNGTVLRCLCVRLFAMQVSLHVQLLLICL